MTKDEALRLALKALDIVKIHFTQNRHVNEAITAIKQALAAPVQSCYCLNCEALSKVLAEHFYTTPPQRIWVGLTDEEKHEIELKAGITEDDDGYIVFQIFGLTEAKLKEKNFD